MGNCISSKLKKNEESKTALAPKPPTKKTESEPKPAKQEVITTKTNPKDAPKTDEVKAVDVAHGKNGTSKSPSVQENEKKQEKNITEEIEKHEDLKHEDLKDEDLKDEDLKDEDLKDERHGLSTSWVVFDEPQRHQSSDEPESLPDRQSNENVIETGSDGGPNEVEADEVDVVDVQRRASEEKDADVITGLKPSEGVTRSENATEDNRKEVKEQTRDGKPDSDESPKELEKVQKDTQSLGNKENHDEPIQPVINNDKSPHTREETELTKDKLKTSAQEIEEASENPIDMKRAVFLERLLQKKVLLEDVMIEGRLVHGRVLVIKSEEVSEVFLRYTIDGWKTSVIEKLTPLLEGDDKLFAAFSFSISVPSGKSVEFVVSCKINNSEFWDSKNGANYKIESRKERDGTERLVAHFDSPKDASFLDYISTTQLGVESASIRNGKANISIGVTKKSGREVGVRYTLDSWLSIYNVKAIPDTKVHEGKTLYDTFIASIDIPNGGENCQFAIFLEQEGRTFWDNNNGRNYLLNLDQ